MVRFLWICLAGAAGTGCRYLIGLGAPRLFGARFPVATLTVNVTGSFLIALVFYLASAKLVISDTQSAALRIGFMGGLTTYSSFNFETTTRLFEGDYLVAVLNVGLTLLGCFAAGVLGQWLAGAVVSHPALGG